MRTSGGQRGGSCGEGGSGRHNYRASQQARSSWLAKAQAVLANAAFLCHKRPPPRCGGLESAQLLISWFLARLLCSRILQPLPQRTGAAVWACRPFWPLAQLCSQRVGRLNGVCHRREWWPRAPGSSLLHCCSHGGLLLRLLPLAGSEKRGAEGESSSSQTF